MNYNSLARLATFYQQLVKVSVEDTKTILSQLSQLEHFKDRIEYAEKHTEHLSSGSARIIYKLPDGQVLKLAKNKKGLAQNKVESDPGMKSKYVNPTIFADKQGYWRVAPFLEKINEKDFEQMTGIDFKQFGDALRYGLRDLSNGEHEKPNNFERIAKTELYQDLVRLSKTFRVLPGDLARISSWAVKDGHPMVLDMGLTREIYDTYYDDSDSSST
jgi:hypothetical protein